MRTEGLVLRLYQGFWAGLDYLYPPLCAGCGKPGSRWCATCNAHTQRVEPPLCAVCGREHSEGGLCMTCRRHPSACDALRSWAYFDGALRQAVHQLKYHRDLTLGEILARPLLRILDVAGWKFDLVVPVPLSRQRSRQRGYNQSMFLAIPIALAMGKPLRPAALVRARETAAQVGLPAQQRRLNVEGAFWAEDSLVRGKSVLLVDDVTTTGATIEACSMALKIAAAEAVYGLTLARSNWPDKA